MDLNPSFLDLPEELILQICQESETKDLIRLTQSSKRFRRICSEIIKAREDEYISMAIDKIKQAKLKAVKGQTEINIYPYIFGEIVQIHQFNPNSLYGIDWVLPGQRLVPFASGAQITGETYKEFPGGRARTSYLLLDKNSDLIEQLAKNLYRQGYQITN